MRKLILVLIIFYFTTTEAQTVSTFMETNSTGCYGLTIDNNFLYVVSSFNGRVHRKELNSTDNSYETYTIGGSGYQAICKVGNYVYLSKPYNGSPGIYRFDINNSSITLENFININHAFGLAYKDSDLFINAADKIYKVDLNAQTPELFQIADNIGGNEGFNNSTIGFKVMGNYLYISETTGISKINLVSGSYEKEIITTYTGTSFTFTDDETIYLTGNTLTGVDELNLSTETYSNFAEIDNFIGTYDIVSSNNSLFVTTREGEYNKVAKIELNQLHSNQYTKSKPIISPNPANDILNLSHFDEIEEFTIINQLGQEIIVKNNYGKIDISKLESGIYILCSKNWTQKFIKE